MPIELTSAVVLATSEQACDVASPTGESESVRYADVFPSPRIERVSPGHLVAVATAEDGVRRVVWRWFDAVVLGPEGGLVRLWEPAHGEVLARPRGTTSSWRPGGRAYASAGLPGADWWVAGPATAQPGDAGVELDEVARFYADRDLWRSVFPPVAPGAGSAVAGVAGRALEPTGLVANLTVPDIDEARAFYADYLGLTVEEFSLGWVARFRSLDGRAVVQLVTRDATSPEDSVVSVPVGEGIDEAYEEAVRRGFEIVHPLTTEPWGLRRFLVRAPDGNVVNINSHAAE